MKTKLQLIGTILFTLSLAILGTIYLAWLVYPVEISFLGLEKVVYITAIDISYNFDILMTYLTNPFATVLDMPNFTSSADGLKHFADVKHLFHLAQVIFLISLSAVFYFWKEVVRKGYGKLYQAVFLWMAAVPLFIAVLGLLISFDSFFTLFHQVLFPGDSTWLFNPNTDPVIYILPAEFFLHCFIIFLILYELLCLMWLWRVKK
ncbi:TPA: TIGR01906 family membrane protein [Streptococcus suis]